MNPELRNLGTSERLDGYGSMGEGVTVDAAGNVYAGEVGPAQGLTKFIPRLRR